MESICSRIFWAVSGISVVGVVLVLLSVVAVAIMSS